MMNILLKYLQTMPLTSVACEAFLFRTAKLTVIGELTVDDWVYLVCLISYRTTTRLNASAEDKTSMENLMSKISADKDKLSHMFN